MGLIFHLCVITISFIYSLDVIAFNMEKSICGPDDDRVQGNNPAIGRIHTELQGSRKCTATLISKSCIVTAGHCVKHSRVLEFLVPPSNENGTINHSLPEDTYLVNLESIVSSVGYGTDWAVMMLEKNTITGEYPGNRYGVHDIAYEIQVGDFVSISGYGASKTGTLNNSQKYTDGFISKIQNKVLYYQIDTTGGDSGSAVLNGKKQIVGIHTHGGCYGTYTNNGTYIADNPEFIEAIKACLKADASSN